MVRSSGCHKSDCIFYSLLLTYLPIVANFVQTQAFSNFGESESYERPCGDDAIVKDWLKNQEFTYNPDHIKEQGPQIPRPGEGGIPKDLDAIGTTESDYNGDDENQEGGDEEEEDNGSFWI